MIRVKACLNGGRSKAEHPATPVTPEELASDSLAAMRLGAMAVHVHPRDTRGSESLDPEVCKRAVAAIRAAAPSLPIGLSTAEAIDPDPLARAAAVRAWLEPPDFVSVNLSERGWTEIARAALESGIAVEAGLASQADARELAASLLRPQVMRALVEVEGGAEEACAISEQVPFGIPQLWHGYGERTWEVLRMAAATGHNVRVGFEDVLVLPDGECAESNIELIAAALQLVAGVQDGEGRVKRPSAAGER